MTMKTTIIGVGRRGGDIADKIPKMSNCSVFFVDTDPADLARRSAGQTILLASGDGSASDEEVERNNPDKAYDLTLEARSVIEAALSGSDLLILVSGLGGGTGAGGTRGIATLARELGLPSVSLVTRPFGLEGEKRLERARAGARKLRDQTDLMVTFFQDCLLTYSSKATRVREIMSVADEFVVNAVGDVVTLAEGASSPEALRELLATADHALFSYGLGNSEDDVLGAARLALGGPFLDGHPLSRTAGVAVALRSRVPLEEDQVAGALEFIASGTRAEAARVVTRTVDPDLPHAVHLALIVTGPFGDPVTSSAAMANVAPSG